MLVFFGIGYWKLIWTSSFSLSQTDLKLSSQSITFWGFGPWILLSLSLYIYISNQSLFEALGLEFSITTLGSFPASDLWYYEYCFDYFPLEHFKGWQTELLFIAFHCLTVVTSLQGVKRAFPYVASDEAEELVEIQTPMLFKLVRSKALDNI